MKPLDGVRVVVTRAEEQAGDLAAAFAAAGARVEALPLLEVVPAADPRPLARAVSELALYDWLVATSANAVAALTPLLEAAPPARLRFAAVGPATARALAASGIEPTIVAARAHAEGLLAELAPRLGRGQRVLLPQAADARPALAEGLRAAGAEVVVVTAYAKRLPAAAPAIAARLLAAGPLGWVTFTSGSTVRAFAALLGAEWERRRAELHAASIGPATSAELRRLGVEPAAEAAAPTPEGLVAAVAAAI